MEKGQSLGDYIFIRLLIGRNDVFDMKTENLDVKYFFKYVPKCPKKIKVPKNIK